MFLSGIFIGSHIVVMGLPGETPEDIRKSIELIQNLSEYKSLIIPLYFVPIGNLKDNNQ
jgi:radical SAM superfamily enzyme YgiQ (UPF0313 family)